MQSSWPQGTRPPPPSAPRHMPSQAQKKWSQLDVDDNRYLDGEEALALAEWVWCSFRPGQAITAQQREMEAQKIMSRCDRSGDGRIDKEEFKAYYESCVADMYRYRQAHPNPPSMPALKPKGPASLAERARRTMLRGLDRRHLPQKLLEGLEGDATPDGDALDGDATFDGVVPAGDAQALLSRLPLHQISARHGQEAPSSTGSTSRSLAVSTPPSTARSLAITPPTPSSGSEDSASSQVPGCSGASYVSLPSRVMAVMAEEEAWGGAEREWLAQAELLWGGHLRPT